MMASDWIRIRRGIRQLPKTVALARHLSHNPEFMAWWSDPVRMSCRHSVTEIVTFENVTRVTACALTELWFALNDVVGGDCWVPYMAVSDIDDIVGVPGFGDALVAVGWVTLHDEKGLVFPNFSEHNVPQKMRSEPKSDAQRAKEYRERKRGGERVTKRHGASRPEDKSREEEYIPAAPVPTSKPAARSRAKSAVSWTAADGWQGITDGDRQEWAAAYPGAVLDQELAKATAWLKANPSRAGRRNWRAFVVRWLSRCQDQGGTNRSPGRTPGDADKRAALDRKAREFAGLSPAAYRTPKQVAALAAG
ncbi:MAG: hypothetical protein EBR82_72735, partial [Caulobacteraceae bacterium]|nr:hypothetical protein [Caulobacteraceae bacterium]